jgi:hypothetical protein
MDMRFVLAFVVAILAAGGAAAQTRPSSSLPSFGDGLDAWCAQVKLPSSIAICSDPRAAVDPHRAAACLRRSAIAAYSGAAEGATRRPERMG